MDSVTPALTADGLIRRLNLSPHPEGGHYRETYRASQVVATPHGPRAASTAILFLLTAGESSSWHRIRSDELWHHHAGSALLIHELSPTGQVRSTRLGADLGSGEIPQHCVPAGHWFAAETTGPSREGDPAAVPWSLMGCTVAPGFDFQDFQLATSEDLRPHQQPLNAHCPQWIQLCHGR